MKTILEIQKLDRQIKGLEREVDKCPASIDFKNYKKIMQEGKTRFEQLESQANDIIKNYNKSSSRLSQYRGSGDIIKSRNTANISAENISSLINDANSLVSDLSEEHRHMEELVRRAEEVVRKSSMLSAKLTEAKKYSVTIKEKIEQKRKEIEPKVAELEKRIKELELNVQDKDKYDKYKEMKSKGIFPVYVNLEDNFCGGCKVKLSLNFIEKLKTKKMLSCEHCGRIIMLNK